MFKRANNLETAKKLLVKEVLGKAPVYYEQLFGPTFYGVGVERDGTVRGFGCAEHLDKTPVDELTLFDLGALLENDDPDKLSLFEARKIEKEEEETATDVQARLW